MGYTLKRRCNNNVAEALDEYGRSVVVTGLGVGFGVKSGEEIAPERIQLTYVLESQQRAGEIADALAAIPADVLAAARKIVIAAQDRFNMNPISMLLPLAEHLDFALRRVAAGDTFDAPLAFEIEQLYPEEHEFGCFAVKVIRADLGVALPSAEVTAFALHAVSAQFDTHRISTAVRMTEDIRQILTILERTYGVDVDPKATVTARFITHVRYLFARLASDRRSDHEPVEVLAAIKQTLAASWRIAQSIADYLGERRNTPLTEAEIGFLALHVSRLVHVKH